MLESECCKNYICLLCITDFVAHERQTGKLVGCPYGCSDQGDDKPLLTFKVRDVD